MSTVTGYLENKNPLHKQILLNYLLWTINDQILLLCHWKTTCL